MLFLAYIIVGLLVGILAHLGLRDLSELAPQPFEGPASRDDDHRSHAVIVTQDRARALHRINMRFVTGGALLLCALSLEAVNTERIVGPSRSIAGLSAGGALLYLVSGFVLYSQARLALLQSRWRMEGVQVAENVGRRWTRASLLLIGGVIVGAVLLPRAYGLGLLDTLRGGLGLLGYVLALLGYAVVWIFSMLALIRRC